MTEEQIEKAAIKAAVEHKDWHHPQMSFHDGFIAGAHSRDREVMDLEHLLKVEDTTNKVLAEANEKLRNPWVKIAERKPSLETEEERKKKCIVRFGKYGHFAHIILNAQDFLMMSGEAIEGSYWMYLPELKKGE